MNGLSLIINTVLLVLAISTVVFATAVLWTTGTISKKAEQFVEMAILKRDTIFSYYLLVVSFTLVAFFAFCSIYI